MNNHINSHFGDTTLTKVFVGGLAWETPKEALRDHFEIYGEILEAVIICDKSTSRSKGYGFVTFKEAEAAQKACEDNSPMINGRRANCNLASLGARRPKQQPPPPLQVQQGQGSNGGTRSTSAVPAGQGQGQWYYPTGAPVSPYYHHHAIPLPAYGYSPTYIATGYNYNQKLSYGSGAYMYPAPAGQGPATMMPVYPYYGYHQSQTMGVPARVAGPMTPVPGGALISKPPQMSATNTGTKGRSN